MKVSAFYQSPLVLQKHFVVSLSAMHLTKNICGVNTFAGVHCKCVLISIKTWITCSGQIVSPWLPTRKTFPEENDRYNWNIMLPDLTGNDLIEN